MSLRVPWYGNGVGTGPTSSAPDKSKSFLTVRWESMRYADC